jgi:hypothetical protein
VLAVLPKRQGSTERKQCEKVDFCFHTILLNGCESVLIYIKSSNKIKTNHIFVSLFLIFFFALCAGTFKG